jgi:hypothetical protein
MDYFLSPTLLGHRMASIIHLLEMFHAATVLVLESLTGAEPRSSSLFGLKSSRIPIRKEAM